MTSPFPPDTLAPAAALNLRRVTGEAVLLGAIVIVPGYVLGRVARWATRRILRWRGRSPSASAMFGTLAEQRVEPAEWMCLGLHDQ